MRHTLRLLECAAHLAFPRTRGAPVVALAGADPRAEHAPVADATLGADVVHPTGARLAAVTAIIRVEPRGGRPHISRL